MVVHEFAPGRVRRHDRRGRAARALLEVRVPTRVDDERVLHGALLQTHEGAHLSSPLLLLLFSSLLLRCTRYILIPIPFSHSISYGPPQVGDLLDQKNYGIAHARPSDIRAAVDLTLLDLKEKSVLQQLEARWWKERGIRVESSISHEVLYSHVHRDFRSFCAGDNCPLRSSTEGVQVHLASPSFYLL